MSGKKDRIILDTVQHLIVWDKFHFYDESYCENHLNLGYLDSYNFYVLKSAQIDKHPDYYICVLLAVSPLWKGEKGPYMPDIVCFVIYREDPVCIYVKSNCKSWIAEIENLQRKLTDLYVTQGLDIKSDKVKMQLLKDIGYDIINEDLMDVANEVYQNTLKKVNNVDDLSILSEAEKDMDERIYELFLDLEMLMDNENYKDVEEDDDYEYYEDEE